MRPKAGVDQHRLVRCPALLRADRRRLRGVGEEREAARVRDHDDGHLGVDAPHPCSHVVREGDDGVGPVVGETFEPPREDPEHRVGEDAGSIGTVGHRSRTSKTKRALLANAPTMPGTATVSGVLLAKTTSAGVRTASRVARRTKSTKASIRFTGPMAFAYGARTWTIRTPST